MKKIIRLTEQDLTKIVRRVLQEQVEPNKNPVSVVEECFTASGVDIKKYPKCMALGNEVMTGRKPSPDMMNACAKEISSSALELGMKAFTIGSCVMEKMKSPVMY